MDAGGFERAPDPLSGGSSSSSSSRILTPQAGASALARLVSTSFQPQAVRGGSLAAGEKTDGRAACVQVVSEAAIRCARARGWEVSVLDIDKLRSWPKLSDGEKLALLKELLS